MIVLVIVLVMVGTLELTAGGNVEFFNEFRKLSAKLKKGIVADDVPIIKDKLAELEEMPLSDEERKFLGILRQELDEAVAGLPQEKKECSLSWFWPVLDCP